MIDAEGSKPQSDQDSETSQPTKEQADRSPPSAPDADHGAGGDPLIEGP